MNKTILTIIAVMFTFSALAQVRYTYDASGNRISRVTVTEKSAKLSADSTLTETTGEETPKEEESGFAGEINVQVYPNPTTGEIYIRLSDVPSDNQSYAEVWAPGGTLLKTVRIRGLVTGINLKGRPSGIYLLRMVINGQPVSRKIVKR